MSDIVVDSSVVAKWVLPEPDSDQAHALLTRAGAGADRLVILDLALSEVANAIWKRQRRHLIDLDEAKSYLRALLGLPVQIDAAARLLQPAFEIATRYDRAIYDALFVALAQDLGAKGVTADEPLFGAVRADFPQIVLLRDW